MPQGLKRSEASGNKIRIEGAGTDDAAIDARYLLELQEEQRLRVQEREHDSGGSERTARTDDVPLALERGEDRSTGANGEPLKRAVEPEPANGQLREDPNNPGTYIGYRRNPPAARQ